MSVTLNDIANMAGVHKSTVDKVVHNQPGVSDERRREIQKLLDQYHYGVNPLAKALNYQKKKWNVAVVLPMLEARHELMRGIEKMKNDLDHFNIRLEYHVVAFDASEEAKCLYELLEKKVSGIVMLPIDSVAVREAVREVCRASIPVVFVNSDMRDAGRLAFVGEDAEKSARTAARFMEVWMNGKGKVGILYSEQLQSVWIRKVAFQNYLKSMQSDIRIAESVSIVERSDSAYQGVKGMLERNPDLNALYITCGEVESACRAVSDGGKKGHLLVFCFDGHGDVIRLIRSGEVACSICADLVEQGRIGMRLMFEYLIYGRQPEKEYYYTQNEVMLKENV